MLESRWQWAIIYSHSRDNWYGFVDVLFGDEGCEIVGEWGVVVLILVEREEDSHFNFLYKRAWLRESTGKRWGVRHVSWWILKYTGWSQIPTTSHVRFADWFERNMVFGAGLIVMGSRVQRKKSLRYSIPIFFLFLDFKLMEMGSPMGWTSHCNLLPISGISFLSFFLFFIFINW